MQRRWLIVGLCFCAFTGCVSCQSNYDYCGPMPENGGDFMYRKNSILGGDSSMPLADESKEDQAGENEEGENGPEPTPAPAPDEMLEPGLDLEGDESPDMLSPDGEPQAGDDDSDTSETAEELTGGELTGGELTGGELTGGESPDVESPDVESEAIIKKPISTLQWHAPAEKPAKSPIKQVRFR